MRAEHVLGIDGLATAGTGAQLARGTARFGKRRGLQLERSPLRHRQRRPDDHVDEQAEYRQQERDPGGEHMERHARRTFACVPECPVGKAEPEGDQVEDDDVEKRP